MQQQTQNTRKRKDSIGGRGMQTGGMLSQSGMPPDFRGKARASESSERQTESRGATVQDIAKVQQNLKEEIKDIKGGSGYTPMTFEQCFHAALDTCKEFVSAVVDCVVGFFS